MTETQKRILGFITDYLQEHGLPPTLREIGTRCGIKSTGSVTYHLEVLEKSGMLKRREASSRGVELSDHPLRIPILGAVSAGAGILAQQNIENWFDFKDFTLGTDFLLRVKGDSMIDAGIMEGDMVQVRRQPSADDGDVVVAMVGEEAVVKTLRRRGGGYVLESANIRYAPITFNFQIIGKVIGLVRRYAK